MNRNLDVLGLIKQQMQLCVALFLRYMFDFRFEKR